MRGEMDGQALDGAACGFQQLFERTILTQQLDRAWFLNL